MYVASVAVAEVFGNSGGNCWSFLRRSALGDDDVRLDLSVVGFKDQRNEQTVIKLRD